MVIMRGPSGSGKSAVVGYLQETYPECMVCSANHYFTKEDGANVSDRYQLTKAHQACQQKAVEACRKNNSVEIIDNTNIYCWK